MKRFSLERQAKHILNDMAKIPSSLGRLEELAIKIVEIQNRLKPTIKNPTLLLACADHKIIEEGVSASTSLITYQQVRNFQNGGGACALLAKENNVAMNIYNIGIMDEVDPSWNVNNNYFIRHCDENPIKTVSMSREDVISAINNGKLAVKDLVKNNSNTIVLGEMGVGNTTTSSLLISSILKVSAANCVNKTICATDEVYKNKINLIEKAKALHEKNICDIYDTIACYGGLEIAFLAGAILQSYEDKVCVLIDGFITTTALLIASKINPECVNNCISCTKSGETTQDLINEKLNLHPLLDLNMSLGEGTGALTAISVIKNACTLFNSLGSCYHDGVTNVHPHIDLPFPLGTTSYIIPDNIENNLKYLTTLKEIEDIELVFFESKWKDSIPDKDTIKILEETAKKYGISYTVHLPYDVDIASSIEEERLNAIETWSTFINLTKELPIHGYVGHIHLADGLSIDSPLLMNHDKSENLEDSIHLSDLSLQKILLDTNIDSNLLCIETLEQPFDMLLSLIKKLDLRVALDVGHLVRFNNYSIDNIKKLLPYTRIIHLHGVNNQKDHQSLVENTDFDLQEFIRILQDFNYSDIVVTIEVFKKAKLLDSIEYLIQPKDNSNA
jgi:nicotinate-nucleotide--dimethylbenzimidazole phosphoribosyltransferase